MTCFLSIVLLVLICQEVINTSPITKQFPMVFDVTTLNGSNGFFLTTLDWFDIINTIGDVNSDGITDLIIGDSLWGSVTIIFGQNTTFPSKFNVNNVMSFYYPNPTGQLSESTPFGYSLGPAGDINKDGISDIIIGVPSFGVYVIFGSKSLQKGRDVDITAYINSNTGIAITRAPFGYSVSTAGDFNDDGYIDFITGAPPNTAYVFFGKEAYYDITTFYGVTLTGPQEFGSSVSSIGDINGDGIADLAVGAPMANNYAGAVYVIFGFSPSTGLLNATKTQLGETLNVSKLNGANGFEISGVGYYSYFGSSISAAGDVNGDGIEDLIIGAPTAYEYGDAACYVIFGQSSGFSASLNITTLNGVNGFQIIGEGDSGLGSSISSAGDINGDGLADLIIGAPNMDNGAGAGYVIFGKSSFNATLDVTTLNGAHGFKISGLFCGGNLGVSVTAGDINGDGKADIILLTDEMDGGNAAGIAAIFNATSIVPIPVPSFNPTVTSTPVTPTALQTLFSGSFNITMLNGVDGFQIIGPVCGELAISASTAGDVNGDGITDLIIGAPNMNNGAGAGYMIFGKKSGFSATLDVTILNTNYFQVSGLGGGSELGISVSTAGDINGDGKADFVIGANGFNHYDGAGYVIFGQGSGFPATLDVNLLNGVNGFKISGFPKSLLGTSVGTVGDINGDGLADIFIGASFHYSQGVIYVIFGKKSGFLTTLDVGTLNGTNGFSVSGYGDGESFGTGDFNGDGRTDLWIGITGKVYVIFGKKNSFSANLNVTLILNNTNNNNNGFQISAQDNRGSCLSTPTSVGDINGDGISDIVVGCYSQFTTAQSFVIFGQKSLPETLDVLSINGFPTGFVIVWPVSTPNLINSVSTGDIDGDGIDDILIGFGRIGYNTFPGAGYVIYGQASGIASPFDVSTLNGVNGFQINGFGSNVGEFYISIVGDVNGDGMTDLFIGTPYQNILSGTGYVIFGQSNPNRSPSNVHPPNVHPSSPTSSGNHLDMPWFSPARLIKLASSLMRYFLRPNILPERQIL